MSHHIIPVEPFDFVIIGATGDLSMRKLLPALYKRFEDGQIPLRSKIIGSARTPLDDDEFKEKVQQAIQKYVKNVDGNKLDDFLTMIHYIATDVFVLNDWHALQDALDNDISHDYDEDEEEDEGSDYYDAEQARVRIFYLSVGPSLFEPIINGLKESGLNQAARLVVEKPLGYDLASAKALNKQLAQAFEEDSIYRIDHYLGKETVQNLMALRFANGMFEPLWNSKYINHVQITVSETLGLEGRGDYYDKSGAMRDMVQNHLMQLLCLTAMEPPYKFDATSVRDEKLKVLKSLKPIEDDEVFTDTVRGQYRGLNSVKSYHQDVDNEDSKTESFVAIKAQINNWRWTGTPFYLRTGKRLRANLAEIVIVFKKAPHSIFTEVDTPIKPNELIIRLQPDEGIDLSIMTKEPGPGGFRLRSSSLDTTQEEDHEEKHMPDAYERLLLDVVRGNQTLFMRGDEVEAAWQWIDPIINAWRASSEMPEPYDPYSEGPTSAVELIARDLKRWRVII